MTDNGKYGGAEYDAFLSTADVDDRVGDHDLLVQKVIPTLWPSGDPCIDVDGVLLTARNADVGFRWSPPPGADVLKAEAGSYDTGKTRAIANAIRIARALNEHYGKGDPSDLKPGDVVRVKTVKTKVQTDGRGGFIRIIAVLPPAASSGKGPAY